MLAHVRTATHLRPFMALFTSVLPFGGRKCNAVQELTQKSPASEPMEATAGEESACCSATHHVLGGVRIGPAMPSAGASTAVRWRGRGTRLLSLAVATIWPD